MRLTPRSSTTGTSSFAEAPARRRGRLSLGPTACAPGGARLTGRRGSGVVVAGAPAGGVVAAGSGVVPAGAGVVVAGAARRSTAPAPASC